MLTKPTAELVTPTGLSTNKAKAEIQTSTAAETSIFFNLKSTLMISFVIFVFKVLIYYFVFYFKVIRAK